MRDNDTQIYTCPECGLHYRDEATAKACEAFCKQHHACSLEIAAESIENNSEEEAV